MVCFQKHLFVLALFLFNVVQSKICDLKNIKCVTRAGVNNFRRITSGIPGLIGPLETLHEDKIVGKTTDLEYILTNTTLYGVKNCEVKLLSINSQSGNLEYIWECPHLVLDTDFVAKGTIGNINIDHEGSLELLADDYLVTYKGSYGKTVNEKDQTKRVFVNVFEINTEPKRKISFTCALRKGDETIAESLTAYFDDNWQNMENLLRSPTMDILCSHFVEIVNIFLKAFPIDEVIADVDK